MGGRRDRALTSVLANVLMVAVVIVMAIVLVTLSFAFLEDTGTPTAEASFEYEQSPSGLYVVPEALGTDVTVQWNGKYIESIEAGDAGQRVLVPTAPGDTITIVSRDEDRSVLVTEEIDDRSEIGDFIAYYTFDQSSNSTVVDRSGNGNDGERKGGGTTRVSDSSGTALDFDGSTGTHVDVGNLSLDGPNAVDELTVAIKYRHRGGSNIQNLIEHQDANFAWFMETKNKFGDPHQMEFNIGFNTNPSGSILTGDIPAGETQVLIGTYDGNEMVFYRNGTRIGSRTFERDVALGEVILGADSDPTGVGQNFDGRIYETRLYFSAFDDAEVKRITAAMED